MEQQLEELRNKAGLQRERQSGNNSAPGQQARAEAEYGTAPVRPMPTPPQRTTTAARERRQRADLYLARQEERLQQRLAAHNQIKSGGGKAIASRAVAAAASGIIKQSNFFYGLAFACALAGDILDFLVLSLPLFDFILGLLLLTLVYPYISDPKVRLLAYFISSFDFVPLVGLLPFWTLATLYAWRTWAKERQKETAAEMSSRELSPSPV